MEELRPCLADRLVLSLVNRQQVSARGFNVTASGGVEMNEKTRKLILTAWQSRKEEEIKHPFLGDTITIGLIPHIQAQLLARHIRGDLDTYPAFFWK
jgi:CRISPR-associated protein Cas1